MSLIVFPVVILVYNRYSGWPPEGVPRQPELLVGPIGTTEEASSVLRAAGFEERRFDSWLHPRSGCVATLRILRDAGELDAHVERIASSFESAGAPLVSASPVR
ncbi:MAG: hypothetical protein V1856_00095 [Candidatus Liptonbacteria bacterium]